MRSLPALALKQAEGDANVQLIQLSSAGLIVNGLRLAGTAEMRDRWCVWYVW